MREQLYEGCVDSLAALSQQFLGVRDPVLAIGALHWLLMNPNVLVLHRASPTELHQQ